MLTLCRCPALLVLAVLLAYPAAGAHAADRPDLTGTWILNKDRSDAPDDRDRGRPKTGILGTAPGVGGSGPMGGAGIRGPLMGGRNVDPALRDRMRELGRLAFEAPESLTITAEGETLRLVDDNGHATRLTADGSRSDELAGTLAVQRRTRWDDDRLVTEIKAKGGGGEVKHVYERRGDRLIVEATFDGEVAARTEKLTFVYDRKEE